MPSSAFREPQCNTSATEITSGTGSQDEYGDFRWLRHSKPPKVEAPIYPKAIGDHCQLTIAPKSILT